MQLLRDMEAEAITLESDALGMQRRGEDADAVVRYTAAQALRIAITALKRVPALYAEPN